MSFTNFRVALIWLAEVKLSDWLKEVTWLGTFNQRALFHRSNTLKIVYDILWHPMTRILRWCNLDRAFHWTGLYFQPEHKECRYSTSFQNIILWTLCQNTLHSVSHLSLSLLSISFLFSNHLFDIIRSVLLLC